MIKLPGGAIRVAVLRGGPSSEYDESLRTGALVLSHLRNQPEKYHPLDIFISKDGEWHLEGVAVEPHVALAHADLAWNALHGTYGEDGQVQKLLSALQMPHTGSSTVASILAYRKDMARKALSERGVDTIRFQNLNKETFRDEDLIRIFQNFLHPVRVRPSHAKAALAHIVHAYRELETAVKEAFTNSQEVIIEEWPRGREVHAGVIESFRNEKLYGFIPVPQAFSNQMHKKIESTAKLAHQVLGLEHYSSSHCLVTKDGKVYVIETHALPHLGVSPMSEALDSVGVTEQELVLHLVDLVRR